MIKALTKESLDEQLDSLNIKVPPRGKERTKDHAEKWAVVRLLGSLAESGLLNYPLMLIKRERPDFLLELPSEKIGIEHVEAVSQNQASIDALRNIGAVENTSYMRKSIPGEKEKKYKALAQELERNRVNIWAGNASESEWAEAMMWFIKKKQETAQKEGFELFAKNWLLVYSNWRVPALDASLAIEMLQKKIQETGWDFSFEKIFIVVSDRIGIFTKDYGKVIPQKYFL